MVNSEMHPSERCAREALAELDRALWDVSLLVKFPEGPHRGRLREIIKAGVDRSLERHLSLGTVNYIYNKMPEDKGC
jgi:hypothetical protein